MKERASKFIREQALDGSGEVAIDIIVKMMITFFLIYTILQVVPILTIHTNMSHVAEELARTIELAGQFESDEYNQQLEAYCETFPFMRETRIDAEPDNPADYFSVSERKIAFRKPFTLRMEYTYQIRVINPTLSDAGLSIPVTISKTVYGTSEIYWKD